MELSITGYWLPLFFFFKIGSHYIAQAGPKLSILLPQLECQDYKQMPPCPTQSDNILTPPHYLIMNTISLGSKKKKKKAFKGKYVWRNVSIKSKIKSQTW
jgi:hypothetical protein